MDDRARDLRRIALALSAARSVFRGSTPEQRVATAKASGDPVTEVEKLVNSTLQATLCRKGDGWLSEETADDPARLSCGRVWIVDPIDGTREFVEGIPEFAVSVGLAVEGRAVAGGVFNPATDEMFLGAEGMGVTLNGEPTTPSARGSLDGAVVLASRSELKRGEWSRFSPAPFNVRPLGSAAYKLARVAAGQADATWSVVPKNEWDIAGGIALLLAAGGRAVALDGAPLRFNSPNPLLSGFIASTGILFEPVTRLLLPGGRH